MYSKTVVTGNQPGWGPLGTNGLAYNYQNPANVVNNYMPQLYAKAYDRFADKVWGDAQMLLAVDLAERGETLRMLGDALHRLAKASYLVRHRQFKNAMKALGATPPGKNFRPSKEFFANWMALRYGWTPTLGSVHSLCESLAKPITGTDGLRVSASAKDTYLKISYDNVTKELKSRNEWGARVRLSGKIVISDPRLAGLNQYGLLNPLSVAWELVSKSFVIGWFLPIGDMLSDLSRFIGISFSQATVSYSISGLDIYYLYSPNVTYNSVLKQRSLFANQPPMPSRLRFGNGLNPKRCMDALALLANNFKNR